MALTFIKRLYYSLLVLTAFLIDFYNMLVAQNLFKKYSNLTVVNNVSLTIDKGEIISVIGASGAGKSTLLHLLGSLDKPDAGSVTIKGVNLFELSSRNQATFRNREMGFVFQFHHLLPEFSAVENVCVPLWINGKSKAEAMVEAQKMLKTVGLGNRLDNKPSELSGGEQQRVAIARALVNKPSIVMADEPTGNLDSNNAASVHELFLQLREEFNQTIIMITHNEELAKMTDRTLIMKDGSITDERINK